jgi:hypothetical protein
VIVKLSALPQTPETKDRLIADILKLVDEQVAAKKGVSGLALKGAYRVVKGLGADYLPGVVGRLLPEILTALEPFWAEGAAAGDPVAYVDSHRDRAADTLLAITDRKAAGANSVVRSVYQKLRASIQPDVAAAMPSLAKILAQYTQPQPAPAG